jgi:hypothetical protein
LKYEKSQEAAEKDLRELIKNLLENFIKLEENWPILAMKYSDYLPKITRTTMTNIRISPSPLDLALAYADLGDLEELRKIEKCLMKDAELAERLKVSSNLYSLAIELELSKKGNFLRYFTIDTKERIFYLASLKYLEEYKQKIKKAIEDLGNLKKEAQKKLGEVSDTGEDHHICDLPEIREVINSLLPQPEDIISEYECHYNHPIVDISNQNATPNPAKIMNLLTGITKKYWEILSMQKKVAEKLDTLSIFMQAHPNRN